MSRHGLPTHALAWARLRSPSGRAALVLVLVALVSLALYRKPEIQTLLRPGHTITAEFEQNYKLVEDESRVKFSGLDVGVVADVQEREDGTILVSMKVDDAALDKLGSEPSARIVPGTILSGVVSVELISGGGTSRFAGESIPRERTRTPVELDRILEALPEPTRQSLQQVTASFHETLRRGGRAALRSLVRSAPATLRPSRDVLVAAQGTRPRVDLPQVVTHFHSAAAALSAQEGQLSDIIRYLHGTTSVMASRAPHLQAFLGTLPRTLRTTRAGVVDLRGTLDRLAVTARDLHPVAEELAPLLAAMEPTLRRARPMLADLRPLARDLRPLLDQLVPMTRRGSAAFEDLRGPVMRRVKGPIADTVTSTWRGSGPYAGNGVGPQADHKFYEELGYLVSNADRGSMYQDSGGSMLGFQVGFNLDSLAPALDPLTLLDLVNHLESVTGGRR